MKEGFVTIAITFRHLAFKSWKEAKGFYEEEEKDYYTNFICYISKHDIKYRNVSKDVGFKILKLAKMPIVHLGWLKKYF